MIEEIIKYIKFIFKWIIYALHIGLLCGVIGGIFSFGVSYVTIQRQRHPYLLYLLPLGGLLIVFLYSKFNIDGKGTDDIIYASRKGKKLPHQIVPIMFISTIITHLFGGSAGREGAALQIGGGLGNFIASLLKLDERHIQILTRIGMSAFFSALFNTPMAAAAFGTMVSVVGEVNYMIMFPSLIASIIASMTSVAMGNKGETFIIESVKLTPMMLLKVMILAFLCAIVSMLFVKSLHLANKLFKKYLPNNYVKVIVGGIIIIILTKLLNTTDYNGAGMNIIEKAIVHGEVIWYAFLLKIIFTAITLESGYKGGEVVPSFFIGSTFGGFIAPVLGLSPTLGAALGMIGVFAGATNTFLSSVFLAIEVFQGVNVPLFGIMSIICFMFSGYNGFYSKQKIKYSKLSLEKVDAHPNIDHGKDIDF